jgi:hypothetical protein
VKAILKILSTKKVYELMCCEYSYAFWHKASKQEVFVLSLSVAEETTTLFSPLLNYFPSALTYFSTYDFAGIDRVLLKDIV